MGRKLPRVITTGSPKKLFLKYFISYIVILSIPISISFIYFDGAMYAISRMSQKQNIDMLKQSSAIFDERMDEVKLLAGEIVRNPYVQSAQHLSNPFQYPNMYKLIQARNSLNNYSVSNKFIMDYYVFLSNKTILNGNIIYTDRQFYDLYMNYDGMNFNTWKKEIYSKKFRFGIMPQRNIEKFDYYKDSEVNKKKYEVLSYTQPLMTADTGDNFVMVFIDKGQIDQLFSQMNISGNGLIYIQNRDGIVLYSLGELEGKNSAPTDIREMTDNNQFSKVKIDGNDMTVTRIMSAKSGLTFVAVQTPKVTLSTENDLLYLLVIVLVVALLVGLFFAYFLAKNNARPVEDILTAIDVDSHQKQNANAFSYIKDTIARLREKNEDLAKALELQAPVLKQSFIGRILKGNISSEDEINSIADYVGVPFRKQRFTSIIISFYNDDSAEEAISLDTLQIYKVILKKAIQNVIEDPLLYDVAEDKLVLLIISNNFSDNKIKSNIECDVTKIRQNIPSSMNRCVFCAVGKTVDSLGSIANSYEEAEKVINYGCQCFAKPIENLIWYDDKVENTDNDYFFPRDMQIKLFDGVKTGNKAIVKNLLHVLFTANFVERNLSINLQRLFIYDLYINIFKIARRVDLSEKQIHALNEAFANLEQNRNLYKVSIITNAYLSVCDYVKTRNETKHSNMIDAIILYICESYTDSNLSLSSVADKFGLSEAYLSSLFKSYTGENFSVYIENLRMKKAAELLTNTKLPVYIISQKVGYYSINTFDRVFKKVYEVSATVYRSSVSENNIQAI